MERLIEFFSANFFFVVLIGIFLVSLLSGKRGKSGSSNRMPDFSGQGMPSAPRRTPGRSGSSEMNRDTGTGMSGSRTSQAQQERRSASEEQFPDGWSSAADPSAERGRDAAGAGVGRSGFAASGTRPRAPQEPPSSPGSIPASKDTLHPRHAVQGAIWAEILGPPRAKKPFRR
ncbi:hypothetical protein [Paenibacillus sp. FJAT-26967]|uniref:hypothetical protein n=1 Tax=Paenibacillus sp. FJAT-26967 TaxID=1729690 RepID=UPI000838DBAA|nr:hypothetical protein [Paenibacillus sp. FJAT-26967]